MNIETRTRYRKNMIKIDKKNVKRILLITLSNIGDVVLTTPVLNVLGREFPDARLDVMVGPLGKDIFKSNPRVFKVIVYNKHIPVNEKRRLINKLRGIKYDLIVDLRNTLFPLLVGSKYRTSPIIKAPEDMSPHKKDSHLWKLKQLGIATEGSRFSVFIDEKTQAHVDGLIDKMSGKENLVTISPGSKSLIKKWNFKSFVRLCDRLSDELGMAIVMVGDESDRPLVNEIESSSKNKIYNLAGRTSIIELAYLIRRSRLLVTNDSAPLHLGSAMETRVLAIFGPTDPRKYGPLGSQNKVIKKDLHCSPCELAQCRFNHECMKSITADEVFEAAKEMLE